MKLEDLKTSGWEIHSENHAHLILLDKYEKELEEFCAVLAGAKFDIKTLIGSGGGQAPGTLKMRDAFYEAGWHNVNVEIKKEVSLNSGNKNIRVNTDNYSTHEIDHFKMSDDKIGVACEIEWNSKDGIFDRDLQNFRTLYDQKLIDVGIIITRSSEFLKITPPKIINIFRSFDLQSIASLSSSIRDYLGPQQKFEFPTTAQKEAIEKKIGIGKNLVESYVEVFISNKYSTTHTDMNRLKLKFERGVHFRTPVLGLGIPDVIIN